MTRSDDAFVRMNQRNEIEKVIRASNPDVFILGDEDTYFRNLANDLIAAGYVKAHYDSTELGLEVQDGDIIRMEAWKPESARSATHTRRLYHDDWRENSI